MASWAPAACSPWAIDQAIERLLATPKTTATRPASMDGDDMRAPVFENEKDNRGRKKSEGRSQKSECRSTGAEPWSYSCVLTSDFCITPPGLVRAQVRLP